MVDLARGVAGRRIRRVFRVVELRPELLGVRERGAQRLLLLGRRVPDGLERLLLRVGRGLLRLRERRGGVVELLQELLDELGVQVVAEEAHGVEDRANPSEGAEQLVGTRRQGVVAPAPSPVGADSCVAKSSMSNTNIPLGAPGRAESP